MGAAYDEGFSEMGLLATTVSSSSPQPYGQGVGGMPISPTLLERPFNIADRSTPMRGLVQNNFDNRCLPVRLRSYSGRQSREWCMVQSTTTGTHQLPRAPCSVLGPETLREHSKKSTCFSENRQLHSRCLYQPPRGHALSEAAQPGEEDPTALPVSARDARTRDTEQGCRSDVPGRPPLCRLAASPSSGGSAMAEIRAGSRRSLHPTRKRAVPSVLLPGGRRCTAGCGCISAPMVKRPSLRLSPSESDLSHITQSERAETVTSSDRPTLAVQAKGSRNSAAYATSCLQTASPSIGISVGVGCSVSAPFQTSRGCE
ncbi:hypothetical protein ACEWY4_002727 [Coilia grayii]|uniref:Uncharacterized protein n=1 Tax=Coilia grayii TaxID=363190 RepID=A0ABD1KPV6_9TELE